MNSKSKGGGNDMKRTLFILTMLLISPVTFGHDLPTYWEKLTQTENPCEISASFWELTGSPFGYLITTDNDVPRIIPMIETESFSNHRRIYESVSKGDGLSALPTYTVDIPNPIESHLPTLIISYSGRQIICNMNWSDDENPSTSNIGSIGHGTQ